MFISHPFGPRPSVASVIVFLAGSALAVCLCLAAWPRLRLIQARADLPLSAPGAFEAVFLSTTADDPGRVLFTTRRENASWARDMGTQAGNGYWLERYGDPRRPGLPPRLLLTSRSRGARLYVPLGALELERALSWPASAAAARATEPARAPAVEHELVQLFVDRSFAGLYLELVLPERARDASGKALDHDLVVVRGNRVRSADFLLRPDGELYRAALVAGIRPTGEFRRGRDGGDELVFLLPSDPAAPCPPLFTSISLFDELGLLWGDELGTIVDDRWNPAAFPAFEVGPPGRELRSGLAWNGALHLAAHIEPAEERDALAVALARFTTGS